MVAVKKGLNAQVGLVLKMNFFLHQTWFDWPPASSGTKGAPFCDHLLQKKNQVHYYHCIGHNIQRQVQGFDGCPPNLGPPIILGVFWGLSLQDPCFYVLLLLLSKCKML